MGRRHFYGVSEEGLNKGPWTEEEDAILTAFVNKHGEGTWRSLPKRAGIPEKMILLFQLCSCSEWLRFHEWQLQIQLAKLRVRVAMASDLLVEFLGNEFVHVLNFRV